MTKPLQPDRRQQDIPLPEVDECRQEVRRVSRRVRAPAAFYHVDENGDAQPLELSLFSEDGKQKLADCMLFDVNDSGIAFATPDILSMDEQGLLCAHHPGTEDEPVVSARISILNERGWPNPSGLPEQFKDCKEMFIYGSRLEGLDALKFLRMVLESLAIGAARGT